MQLWEELEILRKAKKVKTPILCNENNKHGEKFIRQDLQVDHSEYEAFINTSDPANKEIQRLFEEWCRKSDAKIKSNLKQQAKGPTVPKQTQGY